MNTKLTIAVSIFILVLIAGVALIVIPGPNTANAPTAEQPATIPDLIVVDSPLPKSKIASPLTISGKARGPWYFEASAPYQLKDANGNVIAQGPVTAQGEWMTTDFVPFSVTINFPAQPAGSAGTLVLMNDNPSGEPANQKELTIPVTF